MDEQNQTEEEDIEYVDTTDVNNLIGETFPDNPEEGSLPEPQPPPAEQSIKLDNDDDNEIQAPPMAPMEIGTNPPDMQLPNPEDLGVNPMAPMEIGTNPPDMQLPNPEDLGENPMAPMEIGTNPPDM
ncbi:MAG: hypothetical protein LBI37_03025, partial [Puniceicoccales bacterium]|nr:hypothetical protein [Puniceicoccales bacterium]